ncbi:hypothetical protein LWI28_029037 [Acer negundo]|uniref:Uncharacterized protein n=1 Tax=Acer negundo TaxID=4023 RepID=A0AAD5JVG2_ACENE|nr:hypothetical protein LWI28_029037 [Acer negundo]
MEIAARNGWLVEEAERVEIEEDMWVEDLSVLERPLLLPQVCCVGQVTSYFNNRILFPTVSQLREKKLEIHIWVRWHKIL